MAKLECELVGDFSVILRDIEDGILNGSASASLEDRSDFVSGDVRCAVRVFERYSMAGGNRLSMSVTLFGPPERIRGRKQRDIFQNKYLRGRSVP